MPARLLFPDPRAASDALTFASRAARTGDGALRLQASGGVLRLSAGPLAPQGLLDPTPTVLGMRAVGVDPELVCDLVVDATRLVATVGDPTSVDLPESAVTAAWAGISPPRTGWTRTASLLSDRLREAADRGVADVARAVPVDAGEDAVRAVRAAVWSVPVDELVGLPAGVAFAALSLGFLGDREQVRVLRSGAWTRLSLRRGHVLHKGPTRTGLTAVRTTGRGDVRG
ncbi:hypothetical protein [Microbacterium sp.]|uniref:hypothetical protein n=1 Tax=Microbacterium sp. TaxID=51671 RepID=UPI0039E6C871